MDQPKNPTFDSDLETGEYIFNGVRMTWEELREMFAAKGLRLFKPGQKTLSELGEHLA